MRRALGIVIAVLVAACARPAEPEQGSSTEGGEVTRREAQLFGRRECGEGSENDVEPARIRVATFNVRDFGPTKAGREDVMDQLTTIVRQYDIVAIQEISDARGRVPQLFLDHINAMGGPGFAMSISPRTGVHEDDHSAQEQYGFYWNTQRVEQLGAPEPSLFPEPENNNRFDREPWLARFRALGDGGFTFVLVTVHTAPDDAVAEIGALHAVVTWARARWADEDDFIVLGDYNAGCDYATPNELAGLELSGTEYRWIVPHTADTNFSPRTACAYDRIVTSSNTALEWTGEWGVDDDAYTDGRVSDHWPVWAEFEARER